MSTPRAAASAVAPIERSFMVVANPWRCPGFPDAITLIVRIGTPAVAHENPAARADRHAKIVGGWVSLAA